MGCQTSKEQEFRPFVPRDFQADVILFNQRNKVPNVNSRQHDPLGNLFQWIEDSLGTLNGVEQNNKNLQIELGQCRTEINRLQREVQQSDARRESAERQHREELRLAEATHLSTVDHLKRQHVSAVHRQQIEHEDARNVLVATHRSEVDTLKEHHNEQVQSLKDELRLYEEQKEQEFRNLTNKHQRHTKKLVGQLLVNQDDDRGWPDEKFVQLVSKIRRQVDVITSSTYRELRVDSAAWNGTRLDPTDFIARTKLSKLHLLLKSRIWTILAEEFFGQPFGFGMFAAASPASQEILSLYHAWAQICLPRSYNSSTSSDMFSIFMSSRLANRWRAATFSCIEEAVRTQNWTSWNEESMPNFVGAKRRIKDLLSDVAALSHQEISEDLKKEIKRTVRTVLELVLQIGMHPARISLFSAQEGEYIEIGEQFQDCQNKDLDRGKERLVDLVTTHGLQRIGDGLKDLSTSRIIVPCEIYPNMVS